MTWFLRNVELFAIAGTDKSKREGAAVGDDVITVILRQRLYHRIVVASTDQKHDQLDHW